MLLFVAYKWFKVKYLSICHTLSLCWYKNLPLWPKFCFSWYLQKGFSPIVNWPWRFCPPALLSSSNWMENNFREQQPNEDNFLPEKKHNFKTIPFYVGQKRLSLLFAFFSSICWGSGQTFFRQETLFFISNVYDHSLSLPSWNVCTTLCFSNLKAFDLSRSNLSWKIFCLYEMFFD